ncbi:MAG: VWA domain-containing protein [Flavobacteriales bacterium]|nr:VWA domain-containing protein [Flavobacteriales bacterium]
MRFLPLAVMLCVLGPASAQSISGNLNTGKARTALGYGNVDIYRGDKLVASVLTDALGHYDVRLDTGLYRCVVSYDGFISSDRMVRVKGDEKADFTVKADPDRPAYAAPAFTDPRGLGAPPRAEAIRTGGIRSAETRAYSPLATKMGRSAGPAAEAGILTAGEVNDFAKWDLWGDLNKGALADARSIWAIAPTGRYTLDLQTKAGLPIADAEVILHGPGGRELFRARTDNTGKAELWSALDTGHAPIRPEAMEVRYAGQSHRIASPKPFQDGINHLALAVPCGPSDLVDVAFVVDATGSMQDEIDFLTAEMNEVIFRSKRIGDRLNFRFANVFYRDVGPGEEYLTRSMDFTRVLSRAMNFIGAQRADGGGDTPEAVDVALDSAINRLSWSSGARARILLLVLDAGPHPDQRMPARMQQLARQAAAKGIRIIPVAASGIDKATEYLMRTLALATNGTYTFLTDHSGVGLSHLQPTTDRYDVESLQGLLVRILKGFTYMPDCDRQIPELDLQLPDSLVATPALSDSLATTIDAPADSTRIRWSFYPNPTTGLLHITADTDIPALYITDLGGKVLQVLKGLKGGRTVEADLGAYATGIYLIRYPVGDRWLSGKVVLQRE